MANQQEAKRLVVLANAQLNQQNIHNLGWVLNLDNEDLGDNYLIYQANRRRAEGVATPMNRNYPFRKRP